MTVEENMRTLGSEAYSYLTAANLSREQINRLCQIGYCVAPASKGHHLAEKGGLVRHSANVTHRLVELTETLGVEWPRRESPLLVGMLHDLVKCRCYRAVEGAAPGDSELTTTSWKYVQPGYPGHGIASVMIAAEIGIPLLEEEAVAIVYHMGLYGAGKEYSFDEFNNALKLHGSRIIATCCADWYAARVDEEGRF